MSTIRSSVRPQSSKQSWGTILKPDELQMGYQKMTSYEVEQVVNRLYYVPTPKERLHESHPNTLTPVKYEDVMERLTKYDKNKVPDSDRRIMVSMYKEMGVVNSFAWKGYN